MQISCFIDEIEEQVNNCGGLYPNIGPEYLLLYIAYYGFIKFNFYLLSTEKIKALLELSVEHFP